LILSKKYPKPTPYFVKNPAKYVGDISKIVARSSWEKKLMLFLDTNPSILKWTSETFIVPYISPIDSRPHRYFVDFAVIYKTKSGEVKKAMIEVKPAAQARPPERKKKRQATFLKEIETYEINQAKWKAASEFAKKQGMDFLVLTEHELGIK
jgi:hypothetical protein